MAKKYRIYALITVTKEIATIEADSEEEALEKGWNHENCYPGTLCCQCSNTYEINEIDELKAEEIEE